MQSNSAVATIIAALILSLSILASAWLVTSSLEATNEQIASLKESLGEIQVAGGGAAAAARPPRRRGPDPDKEYKVNIAGAPFRGGANAPVTIVEFSDFQCPFCGRVTGTLAQVEKEYGDKVKVVFKHLPLSIHPKAPGAHAAAEAAKRQGKFWEMHDKIFENQREMSDENYVKWAGEIGLDVDKFKADVQDAGVRSKVEADAREAAQLEVTGTPAFFINGKFLSGAQPFSEFKRRIDEALEG